MPGAVPLIKRTIYPGMNPKSQILLFDGVCNLCNGLVQFIIKRDKKDRFRFAALQSAKGQALCQKLNLPLSGFDSIVYLKNGKCFLKSSAALHVLNDLGGFWRLFFGLMLLPKPIRDVLYDLVAQNRYKLFGKRAECMIPTPELKKKFLT